MYAIISNTKNHRGIAHLFLNIFINIKGYFSAYDNENRYNITTNDVIPVSMILAQGYFFMSRISNDI